MSSFSLTKPLFLNTHEIKLLFRKNSLNDVYRDIKEGKIPEPDFMQTGKPNEAKRWKVGTIEEFLGCNILDHISFNKDMEGA